MRSFPDYQEFPVSVDKMDTGFRICRSKYPKYGISSSLQSVKFPLSQYTTVDSQEYHAFTVIKKFGKVNKKLFSIKVCVFRPGKSKSGAHFRRLGQETPDNPKNSVLSGFQNKIQNLYILKIKIYIYQELLYHRTCKRDFLSSWPSLNSYLK